MTNRLDGEKTVFIAGCPRSGTTWLQRLIASHPMVRTGQESFLVPWYIHPIASRWEKEMRSRDFAIGLSAYLDDGKARALFKQIIQTMLDSITAEFPPDAIFLEKTPDNSLYIKEIVEYLPRAKIIHIIRNGRDVVASLLAAGKSWHLGEWKNLNAYSAAKLWVRYLQAVERSKKFVPSDQFFELKYETLLASAEEELEKVYRFIGLEMPKEGIGEAVRRNSLNSQSELRTKLEVRGEKARSLDGEQKVAAEFGTHSTGHGLNPAQKLMVWMAASKKLTEYGYA